MLRRLGRTLRGCGWIFFFVLLDGAVFVKVVALVGAGCVCVVGVTMREEKAGLLLPGGREGKIESYESVCVGGYGWRSEKRHQVYLHVYW